MTDASTTEPVGQLVVLTGPSGVGKGTLVRALLERHPALYLSVSATTRSPRPGEIVGKDYYFVDQDQFKRMVDQEELLEWAEYAGNYYGTPKAQIMTQLEQGISVILEIELLGARQIQKTFPNALRLFIRPPSLAILEQRLRVRGKDSPEAIRRRLARSHEELLASHEFDGEIVNDDLEKAIAELEAVIFQ